MTSSNGAHKPFLPDCRTQVILAPTIPDAFIYRSVNNPIKKLNRPPIFVKTWWLYPTARKHLLKPIIFGREGVLLQTAIDTHIMQTHTCANDMHTP